MKTVQELKAQLASLAPRVGAGYINSSEAILALKELLDEITDVRTQLRSRYILGGVDLNETSSSIEQCNQFFKLVAQDMAAFSKKAPSIVPEKANLGSKTFSFSDMFASFRKSPASVARYSPGQLSPN